MAAKLGAARAVDLITQDPSTIIHAETKGTPDLRRRGGPGYFPIAIHLLERGTIDLSPLVTNRIPTDRLPDGN
jgi:threonine dehydrogenase-like Zn-dependent dehydrogenase